MIKNLLLRLESVMRFSTLWQILFSPIIYALIMKQHLYTTA